MVDSIGLMEAPMTASSMITIFMGKEFILGATEGGLKEIGKKTKWTAKEYLLGLMTEDMKETM